MLCIYYLDDAQEEVELEVDGINDDDENFEDYPVENKSGKKIYSEQKDFSIRELNMMRTDKQLDLRPKYQRNYVFDKQKASRLIESILLDVPMPVMYFAEEPNGKYSVIDGQQRLTSLQ